MRIDKWPGLATLLLVIAGGCAAEATPPARFTPEPSLNVQDELQFSCGRFPFTAALLTAPLGHDEEATSSVAEALRRHLALPDQDINFLPDSGWTLAGIDAAGAEFVTVGGDLGMKSISLENQATGWHVAGWGDCRPNLVLPEGIGTADWTWGSPGRPGPDTQRFTALVTERACASGRSPEGRIVGPAIVPSGDTLLVMFGVRQMPGAQNCPSNPSFPTEVDLGAPLGDRKLLDGGHLPFGDPTTQQP